MIALVWKECHENLKWAVLPILLLAGLEAIFGPPAIMFFATLFILHLIAAGIGMGLGFLQFFFEARDDRRALVVHRPLSQSGIFLGKVISGVGLYLLAVGIPFAWTVIWIAIPGHLPSPFRWAMVLPWLANILSGLVFYFAGILTAQREARWYGSRALGLAAALLCSFLVVWLPEFWHALLAIVVLGALAAVAAWGSFLTGGAYPPQPRLAKSALAGSFLAGLLLLSVTVKVLIGAWSDSDTKYQHILDREGRVLVIRSQQGTIQSVTDLEGHQPQELKGKPLNSLTLREVEAPLSAALALRFDGYRNSGRFAVPIENKATTERWFYVPEQGRLLGYDRKSQRLIGSFGPDGFVPAGQAAGVPFQGRLYHASQLFTAVSPDYLAFPGGVYAVDFAEGAVKKIFTPAEGEIVKSAHREKDEQLKGPFGFVFTDKTINVINETGLPVVSVPWTHDRVNYEIALFGRLENPRRYVIWSRPLPGLEPKGLETMPSYLIEFNSAGRETACRTVPPHAAGDPSYAQALFGIASPVAEVVGLVAANRYSGSTARSLTNPLFRFLDDVTEVFIPGGGWMLGMGSGPVVAFEGFMLLSAAASALVCFLWARRYAFSRARCIGWSMCGVLFGTIGVLLMLAVQEWPARVTCPKCRKPRVVTRATCEHCGAPHAPPSPDGTEIFEPTVGAPRAELVGR